MTMVMVVTMVGAMTLGGDDAGDGSDDDDDDGGYVEKWW